MFESEWNNIQFKLKKAAVALAFMNQISATDQQKIAEPINLIQQIIIEEFGDEIRAKKPIHDYQPLNSPNSEGIRSYSDELEELE